MCSNAERRWRREEGLPPKDVDTYDRERLNKDLDRAELIRQQNERLATERRNNADRSRYINDQRSEANKLTSQWRGWPYSQPDADD